MLVRKLWLRASIFLARGDVSEALALLCDVADRFEQLGRTLESKAARQDYQYWLLEWWDCKGAVFADPANPASTWTGRGQKLPWLAAYLAAGWVLDDCRIGRYWRIGGSDERRQAMVRGELAPDR